MTAEKKRKLLIRLGVVAAVLFVLVIVPGYIASRPEFLLRYEGLQQPYETWNQSVHAKISCQSCHVPPNLPAQVAYDVRMLGEFYASLVAPGREPGVFAPPTDEACSSCHLDLRTVSPAGDLNIPHRAHVQVLKMACNDCHSAVVHVEREFNRPPMAGCLNCHDGTTAKADCAACHTDKDRPETHNDVAWAVNHATMPTEECNSCHNWTEHWCSDCHAKRPASHSEDWRAKHRHQVTQNRNCEACHEAPFCIRCHGELPRRNLNPTLRLVIQ